MWHNRLRKIIKILESSSVNEIEVSFWGRKFRVSKGSVSQSGDNQISQTATIVEDPPVAEVSAFPNQTVEEEAAESTTGVEVLAPIVGTFFRAPSPELPPYVNLGDHVAVDQTLCIIEAMKIFNEIEAEVSGRIAQILVENAQPVEYGQPLFIIEPD